jgi:ABC-type sugar transport system substrate-binding protein
MQRLKMKWIFHCLTTLVILMLMIGSTGCGIGTKTASNSDIPATETATSARPYRIGVSFLTTQLEYYLAYSEDMQIAARDQQVEIILVDAKWDLEKQKSDIMDFIDLGVDAIICSPTNPEEIKPVLIEAQNAGIPVVVEMTYVDGIYPLVSTDQFAGGVLAGEYAGNWINKNYNGRCEVAILDFPYYKNIVDRVSGFKQGLQSVCPTATIVAIEDGQAKLETANKAMAELLTAHPDIRCVFGINDDTIKGANMAYHETGIDPDEVCLIGFDADRSTRLLINNHDYVKASVAARTAEISQACIDSAIRMIEGGQIQDWVEVIDAQYLITQENISEHLED